jgi:hypothetical protein
VALAQLSASGNIHIFMTASQIIATFIDDGSWIAIGIAFLFVIPKFVQKQIESGKMTPEKGSRFMKNCVWAAWFLIALGIFKVVVAFVPDH